MYMLTLQIFTATAFVNGFCINIVTLVQYHHQYMWWILVWRYIYIYFVLKTHKKFTRHATNGVRITLMIKPLRTIHPKKQRYNLTFISIVQYWAMSYISKSIIFHWGAWQRKMKKQKTNKTNYIGWTFFFSWESLSNAFPLS